MCVILSLPAGSLIKESMLFNAVHNNPHGYGIITKKGDTLDVKKGMFMEPDVLYGKLAKNIEFERFVHLRFNTVGETCEENLHPFLAYDGPKKVKEEGNRVVYFMHNGTLSSFKPPYVHSNSPTPPRKESDSNMFCKKFLTPSLSRLYTENGFADYHDEMFHEYLDKPWDFNSKGLLISNDLDPYYIRNQCWKKFEYEDETGKHQYFSSNDDYFKELKRGPLFDRLETERKTAIAVKAQAEKEDIVPFDSCDVRPNLNERILGEASKIFSSVDIWEDEGIADLRLLTMKELDTIMEENPVEFSALFYHALDRFVSLYEEVKTLRTKHENASKHIAQLSRERTKENA